MEEINDEILSLEDSLKQSNIEIKLSIIEALTDRDTSRRGEATEIMVQLLERDNRFYTIRDDDKEEIWAYNNGIYIPNGGTIIKEKCREIMEENNTSQFVNQVIFKIMTDTYVDQNSFFNNNIIDEVVTENGILNLKTAELTPYDPNKIFFTKIPIKYQNSSICPNIIQFLKEVLKTEEDLPVMQELFGYLLWKEYNIERAIMLIGNGRNGKSKTMDLMKRFIGYENYSSIALQNLEGDNFHKAQLHKKLANLCGDIDDRALKFTGSFKELTGRDNITANRKFKTHINFENYAKLIFSANTLPRTHDISEAFFMRWVLLEFPYTFVKEDEYSKKGKSNMIKLRDPNIIQKIATDEEMSGLLNWAIEGLNRLQERKDFTYNKTSGEVKNMWLRKSDSFMAFCLDTIEEQYGNQIRKSEIRHVYHEYCKKHKLKPVGDKAIAYTLMTQFGAYDQYITLDNEKVYVWCGIDYQNLEEKEAKNQCVLEQDLDIDSVVKN